MYRFTIRDVLWLTVVVALAVAWWIDRSRIVREARESRIRDQERIGSLKADNEYWSGLLQERNTPYIGPPPVPAGSR